MKAKVWLFLGSNFQWFVLKGISWCWAGMWISKLLRHSITVLIHHTTSSLSWLFSRWPLIILFIFLVFDFVSHSHIASFFLIVIASYKQVQHMTDDSTEYHRGKEEFWPFDKVVWTMNKYYCQKKNILPSKYTFSVKHFFANCMW